MNESILGEIGSVKLKTENTIKVDYRTVGISAGIIFVFVVLIILTYKWL